MFKSDVYFQNVAEVMFWRYVIEKNLEYELEKQVSTENNCDVDVFISRGSYCYNVEIKTPNNDSLEEDSQVLKVTIVGRPLPKERLEEEKAKIYEDILLPILKNPKSGYKRVEFKKKSR